MDLPQRTVSPGRTYGYARVSRGDSQSVARQEADLAAAGADRVFIDEVSGGRAAETRPGFAQMLEHLRQGDVVVVTEVSRLSRSLADLTVTLEDLVETRGVTVQVLGLGVFDPTSPTTRLLWQVLGAVAELERSLIRERTLSGLAEARRRGTRIGRPAALTDEQVAAVRAMRASGSSAAAVGRAFGVSERTIRRVCEEAE